MAAAVHDGALRSDSTRWDHRLTPDHKRASPEIYRTIRASGAANVREWTRSICPSCTTDSRFLYLWNAATQIDFQLGAAKSDSEVNFLLSSDDSIEINLRALAAFVYLKRTKDASGANHMLAIKPPGLDTDVAPEWMIQEATTHSKMEYRRAQQVTSPVKDQSGGAQHDWGGKGKQPGGKKGKGGKGGGRGPKPHHG